MNFVKKHPFILTIVLLGCIYFFYNYLRPVNINESIDKTSVHYVNNLYYSDGYFYNNIALNENEEKLYWLIIDDLKNVKKQRTIKNSDYGCSTGRECYNVFSKVYDVITLDHPEIISLGSYYYTWKTEESTQSVIDYKPAIKYKWLAKFNEMRILRIIDNISKKADNLSEYERVKFVYEWIGDNTRYNFIFKSSSANQSAYNVFVKGSAVCSGFAKASQLLFQRLGIQSYLVLGSTKDLHMWNIVKIDGEYYYYDSTLSSGRDKNSELYYMGLGATPDNYNAYYSEAYPDLNGKQYLNGNNN